MDNLRKEKKEEKIEFFYNKISNYTSLFFVWFQYIISMIVQIIFSLFIYVDVYSQSIPCSLVAYNFLTDCNLTCSSCGTERDICEGC